jgi:hypothetical protein
MKPIPLLQLIQEIVDSRLSKDIGRYPTKHDKSHTFRGPRLGSIKKDGDLGKVNVVRKDTSATYALKHPMRNPFIVSPSTQRLSDLQVQQLFNIYKYRVDVRDIKSGVVSKTSWSLGNNKKGVKIKYDKNKQIFYKIVEK